MKNITFITGGARSGKSRYALDLTAGACTKTFVATAEAFDDEMQKRIENHKEERSNDYQTIEAPLNLGNAIREISAQSQVAVIDCLTVWLANILHHRESDDDSYPEVNEFLETLANPPCDLVIVSNELGMGIVPDGHLSRRFRDLAGRLNQQVAALANTVVLMISGIPILVKNGG